MYIPFLIAQGIALCFLLAALGMVAVSIGTNYWSETTFWLTPDGVTVENLKRESSYHEVEKVDGLWRECSAIFSISNELIDGTHDSVVTSRTLVYEYCFNRYQNVVDQSRQSLNDEHFDARAIESRDHGIHWWQIACMAGMCTAGLLGAIAIFTTPINYPKCRGLTAFLVLIAAIFCGASIITYSCRYDQVDTSYHNQLQAKIMNSRFGWSLWFAVGACASFLAASFGFVVSAKIRHLRDYTRVRIVT